MAENEEKIVNSAEETKASAPAEKPKKKKGGLIATLACVGVVVLCVAAFLIVAFLAGNQAVSAYNSKDYEAAYNHSKMALFMDQNSKNTILKTYINKVLCVEGDYFVAQDLLEGSKLSQEDKDKIYAENSGLAMCKKGSVVPFGIFEMDGDFSKRESVEWIVLDVVKENGKAKALLMTKDVIGFPGGFNLWDSANSTYAKSGLHSWCDVDFYKEFTIWCPDEAKKVLKTTVSTADSSTGIDSGEDVETYAFAPSKQELETYLTGDLAQYLTAKCCKKAKEEGVLTNKDGVAGYFLRNAGDTKDTITAVTRDGEILEGCAKTGPLGARVCVWIDLGSI